MNLALTNPPLTPPKEGNWPASGAPLLGGAGGTAVELIKERGL